MGWEVGWYLVCNYRCRIASIRWAVSARCVGACSSRSFTSYGVARYGDAEATGKAPGCGASALRSLRFTGIRSVHPAGLERRLERVCIIVYVKVTPR